MPRRAPIHLGLCAAILMLAAGAVPAQESQTEPDLSALKQPTFGADGYYVGTSGVYAIEIGGVPRADEVDGSAGASLRLGYRANRWFAAEIHGEWLNDFAYQGGGFTAWDLMLCGRAYPLRRRLQPFAVAGLGLLQKRDHGTGKVDKGNAFAGRFGVGLDLYINPAFAISMDGVYVIPFTQIRDHDFVSINLGMQWW